MFSDRRKRDMATNHGSMVVLSRPRSSQNAGQKLSVPPPLNLPSLRKEHERVDSSGSGFLSGGGVSGSGARPASSGMGWSKPAGERVEEPLIRSVEKVSTLRGEDFPSLKASLPSASSVSETQKHKDGLNHNQNQKQKREEFPKENRVVIDVRPQNRFLGNEELSERPSFSDGVKKKDYLLPGPLPIVRMSPRSDWADDERDTSHGFRDRDYGYSKNEPVVVREANAWRVSSPLQNEVANNSNNNNNNSRGIYGARPNSRGREGLKKGNYVLSGQRDNVWNSSGAREAHGGGRQPWSNNNGIDHQNRDKRPLFKNDKPHVEDHFGDSGFDVHDPFPVLGVAKKKKEALKQTEFHDPVRESFEAELERVQKMQEEERRRIIEEQERVIELVRTEEEERLRLAREQDEQQSRLEEEAREAAVRNEQERLEAARRAEELRKSKEEEKHKLILEEERRKQAAKQKLLELEEKISRRQAEAAKGCSNNNSSEDVVKEKESSDVDWEDSERMVDRITTSSASRDGSFGFQDRHKPFWRKEDVESGGNSRFIENVPQRDVGEGFPKEFFGTAGYIGNANSYFKPGFPEHSVDQSWRTPGDGRSYGRNYGMEQPEPEQQYGNNPGWGQSQSRGRRGGAYPSYPEKLYPNHEEDDYYPFGRPKYSVRQPRVLPPPPQESRQKLPFRSEAEHHPGPSSSVLASYIGDLQDHHHVMSGTGMDDHRFDSKLTGRCDSQSSLSITSTPDSLVHISHDDLDESGNSSVLVSSRKGDGGGGLLDAGKDSLMNAACPVSCWDNEEWALDNNERLQEQEEYDEDEDGYQEEDKVHGVDENIDLTQELEELHLQEKDSNLVLGFNEGVEVEIPSDDLEKCQQKDSFLDGERPSSCDEQTAKPAEVSDNASTSFQGTETNSASYPTVSTHLVAPPYSIGLHQSNVPSASAQMEERVQFQFGLFSGPSLIPSPYPAIQIGSIQMPLPLDPQYGSSLTHIQQPQSPFIQFGQVGYTSLITQGVLPPPPPPQNPGSMATGQLGQGRNAAAPASNHQISVLRRPVDVSDGDKLKNANISPASVEAAVAPPHKQGEFSGKSEPASRKMNHGRSNFTDRQSGGGQVVSRNSGGAGEASRGESGGYRRYQRQRVEFRVRESNWPSEENRNGNGKSQNSNRSGSRKYVVSKSQKYSSDSSVSGSNSVQKVEGPSDDNDDDFIEVRSKRQMLNDRREQREKEIKEKSQASKASRKPRSTVQNSTAAARSYRSPPGGRVVNTKQINPVSNRQLLAPIGTPSPKTDSHGDEKTGSSRDIPDQNPASSFVFSNKNNVLESVQTSVGTWSNQLTDQPVMALTQSQLDEAMKPASLLSCVSVENGVNRISEPNPKSTSSVAPSKNNTFPSPVNSLLAEGKIQFGAVTSSSVIPPCGENNTSLYFEKDRTPSSSGMEICEAEAAASAIAVAAITSDETSGNTASVLPTETKIYGGTSGTAVAQPSLSKAEESLTVSLPADLSVETPISLWPPVPSPHNSNQMITHFPQAPPHFPFYDMNPMLRGPIYAFGPHHDSGANQPQSQKGPSGPPTTWQQQQGHSGVDSFYAPAGFTGPFLTPPGAMPPGVQGPPHMFVYNHFAPVGQFGGLSFMGTTYIPSGKQPDWKHNPMVSSSQAGGDGDVNNPTVSPMQCNVVPASLQHLAMPSPLAMFEPSPFQSSSSQEMPVRARWPYMPFPGPPAMQIQNQQEAVDGSPSQFNNNNNMLPPPSNRYPNIQTPTVADAADSSNSYGSTASQPKPITTLSDPNTQNPANPAFKPPPQPQQQQQSSQEKNTQSQHVGGSSHHNQHQHQHNRRSGFHGRNQAVTRERGYHNNNTKVKQIYVAKQTSSNSNNASASASSTTTASPSI
ncbi:BnaAnng03650D [Brassica napus]|uniref:BnaAnng03650D protein n=1 Tax=Brassica napus TaxID=3708 RepID=A0A078GVU5_BRANA|nr:BnaAnng03650D [Brassica napus]